MKLNRLFLFVVLVLTAACQRVSIAEAAAPAPNPGVINSALGASVFTLQQNENGTMVMLKPLLAGTSEPTPGMEPVEMGQYLQSTFSADEGLLIYTSNDAPNCEQSCLHVFDLQAWEESIPPIHIDPINNEWIADIAYDPERQLAAFPTNNWVSNTSRLILVDLRQSKIAARLDLEMNTNQVGFTTDGELAIMGEFKQEGRMERIGRAVLLDGSDLKLLWTRDLPEVHYSSEDASSLSDPLMGRYLTPAVVQSHDKDLMYIVTADEDKLVTVDFSGRSVKTSAVKLARSWIDRLVEVLSMARPVHAKMLNGTTKSAVLSANGKTLYVTGQTTTVVELENGEFETEVIQLGLQVIDAASGELKTRLDTKASMIRLTPDGESLLLTGWGNNVYGMSEPWTEVMREKDLKVVTRLRGEVQPTRLLNGDIVWLGTEWMVDNKQWHAIYADDGKMNAEWFEPYPDYSDWVVVE
jgi:hypothetical protein